jgi:hypothetical protein
MCFCIHGYLPRDAVKQSLGWRIDPTAFVVALHLSIQLLELLEVPYPCYLLSPPPPYSGLLARVLQVVGVPGSPRIIIVKAPLFTMMELSLPIMTGLFPS